MDSLPVWKSKTGRACGSAVFQIESWAKLSDSSSTEILKSYVPRLATYLLYEEYLFSKYLLAAVTNIHLAESLTVCGLEHPKKNTDCGISFQMYKPSMVGLRAYWLGNEHYKSDQKRPIALCTIFQFPLWTHGGSRQNARRRLAVAR